MEICGLSIVRGEVMAKGIYGKYNADTYLVEWYNVYWRKKSPMGSLSGRGIYSGYTFDNNTGMFTGVVGRYDYSEIVPEGVYIYAPRGYKFPSRTNINCRYTSSEGTGDKAGGWVVDHEIKYEPIQKERKGIYIKDVIAEYGSLPSDGKHTDGYWYVFVKMASDLKVNVGGVWKDTPTGYVNVNGVWKPQSEFKVNVSGIYK